jgi:hypothetical protein
MRILLKDHPGTRDFINRVVNAAEDLAIAVTGKPDHEVLARLRETNGNLKRELAPLIGAEAAAEIADMFCRAVMGEKHEREALAAMGLYRT